MVVTCQAEGCNSPSQSLPEKLTFLGTGFCRVHIERLLEAERAARAVLDDNSFVRQAVRIEAQTMLYSAGLRLTALQGGQP